MNNFNSWGLGSVANDWLFSGYTNPYNNAVITGQGPQTTIVYDYSQPINLAAEAPAPATVSSSEQVFSAARDAFKANDFQRALELTDQAIKGMPNVPITHEFRALCLFALRRYDEAAAVNYAVLSAGPGMNWTTLVGLYSDVDSYTNQLRALEAAVRSNPNAPSTQFLLGYHYLVQGHELNAAAQFEKVSKLEPSDQLSASFVKALMKVAEQPAAVNVAGTVSPPASHRQPLHRHNPPPRLQRSRPRRQARSNRRCLNSRPLRRQTSSGRGRPSHLQT
jgi:tetratricopeptide (TPR) repeat protein